MALLIDLFGFLSVLLSGLARTAQSLALGNIAFLLLILPGQVSPDKEIAIGRTIVKLIKIFAAILFIVLLALFLLHFSVLYGSLNLPFLDSLTDIYGSSLAIRLVLIGILLGSLLRGQGKPLWLAILIGGDLLCGIVTSHAAARIDQRILLSIITLVHHLGAALWIGGLPAFLLALKMSSKEEIGRIGLRYSHLSIFSVTAIFLTGVAMGIFYVCSVDAIYGTAYGLMATTKSVLFASLLALGLGNFLLVRHIGRNPSQSALRMVRFVEVELGVGIAIFFAAASMTSLPPAIDLTEDRASLQEIVERMTPIWPDLSSPKRDDLSIYAVQRQLDEKAAQTGANPQSAYIPGSGVPAPRNAADIKWSEYNHHWSGIIVFIVGLLAFWDKIYPSKWSRNWPLAFLLLVVFLFFRSEAEFWPIGRLTLNESLRDPEFVQHKAIMALITGFALFEWRVRLGQAKKWMQFVLPTACLLGGIFLLAHSHSLANVKELLLIEFTHTPLAILGIWAGCARWLELRLNGPLSRWAGWIWPLFFCGVGLTLIFYREI